MDVVIDVGGRVSDMMVKKTANAKNMVSTNDTFSPELIGTMNTNPTMRDVRITGIITFRL